MASTAQAKGLVTQEASKSVNPVEVVSKLLQNTANPSVVHELVSPDATYVSLAYTNANLQKILPYANRHDGQGPDAIINTFAAVAKIWANEEFTVDTIFSGPNGAANGPFAGSGFAPSTPKAGVVDVAVFGSFTYRSRTLGKACRSPYNVWCKVDESKGQVVYMQFMEDTFGTTETFKVGGSGSYGTYKLDPETGREFEV
jgi:hypothetical protein